MKKWFKISGIVAALAALSVLSFAAVSFAQTETPDAQPGLVERFRSGMQEHFGGPGGTRGMRGGEMNADRTEQNAVLAEALGMTEDELQAARDAGQTLTEIAEAQGVDLDTLQATLSADRLEAMKTTLAEKVAAGDITQAQADAMLLRMESSDFSGKSGMKGNRGDHDFSQLPAEAQSALAAALNLSVEDLQAAIDGGQTLTEIAEAQGVDLDTLKSTLSADRLEAMKTTLAEKVAAGDITQEQADAMLEKMESGDFPGRGGMMDGQDGSRDGMRGHPGGRGGMRGVPGNSTAGQRLLFGRHQLPDHAVCGQQPVGFSDLSSYNKDGAAINSPPRLRVHRGSRSDLVPTLCVGSTWGSEIPTCRRDSNQDFLTYRRTQRRGGDNCRPVLSRPFCAPRRRSAE